jgi:biopolymer transport protein ExbB
MPEVTPENVEISMSFLELIMKGGIVMIPIGILSLLSVYFIIERFVYIRQASKIEPNIVNNLRDFISRGDLRAAQAYCKNLNSPAGKVIEKGVNRIGRPLRDIESAMESTANVEVMKMERHMGYLGVIAGVAPMLGFIGTILGIIRIFYSISLTDNISIGIIAGGLYEKMITSGSGLVVGVFAYFGYHILNQMIEKFLLNLEVACNDFTDILSESAGKS